MPVKKKVMKKKVASRKSVARTMSAASDVEAYLARIPEAAIPTFLRLREIVRSAVPADASEAISYGILAFRREKVLVWIAGFADHCSLFPTAEVLAAFEDELKGFSTSKGTVQFRLDKPLPSTLIKRIVSLRTTAIEKDKRRGSRLRTRSL
jgi:uncharacterized protein YdhG (YjbR/CyaY superfamily)